VGWKVLTYKREEPFRIDGALPCAVSALDDLNHSVVTLIEEIFSSTEFNIIVQVKMTSAVIEITLSGLLAIFTYVGAGTNGKI
jgi:hypothetical protein